MLLFSLIFSHFGKEMYDKFIEAVKYKLHVFAGDLTRVESCSSHELGPSLPVLEERTGCTPRAGPRGWPRMC